MKSIVKWLPLLLVLMYAAHPARGQYLETGLTGGGMLYTGDLNPSPSPRLTRPAFGLLMRYNFTPRWVWKNSLLSGRVRGEDLNGATLSGRSLYFESRITELSSQIEFNFLNYYTGSRRESFSPYLFAGLSLFMFNPQAQFNGQWIDLQPLRTEGQDTQMYPDRKPYSRISIALPFGMGLKLSVNKKMTVGMEAGYRKTLTDYLDDVSTTYYLQGNEIDPALPEELLSDPLRNHSPGMQRGNAANHDWYAYAGVFITYKINLYKTPPCNDFKNVGRFN
jgi:hypothetical protein